jgi:nitronate monooxygenase
MRWPVTTVTERLGIRLPIIQAPMAGSTTPELVAAVSEAGGLGSLGAAMLSPDDLRGAIRAIRERTERPFNVNLFAWAAEPPEPAPEAIEEVALLLHRHLRSLDLPDDPRRSPPPSYLALVEAQVAVVAEERVPVFSFAFGVPPLDAVRETGATLIGTATSVQEAVWLEEAGVDMVVAQGAEAGGHRATFLLSPYDSLVGTLALVPQVTDHVGIPVLAAGGIMDGRGIAAALALGAGAAWMGTAFLSTSESAASPSQKAAVAAAADTATQVTDAYTGRAARMVRTRFVRELQNELTEPLPFGPQGAWTRPIHIAAAQRGDTEHMLLLAGQAAALSRELPAAELVATLAREAEQLLA